MLLPGIYKAETENDGEYLHPYEIILDVKETEKSYLLRLIKFSSGYEDLRNNPIDRLFEQSKKAALSKAKGGFFLKEWSNHDFTLYLFQKSVPFYFCRITQEADPKHNESVSDEDLAKMNDAAVAEYYRLGTVARPTPPTEADLAPLEKVEDEWTATADEILRRQKERERCADE